MGRDMMVINEYWICLCVIHYFVAFPIQVYTAKMVARSLQNPHVEHEQ